MKWPTLALLSVAVIQPNAYASRRRGAPLPVRIEVTLGAERLNYADVMFTGHPKLDGRSVGPVDLLGKQFGAKRMGVFDTALHVQGITHHVVLGVNMGLVYADLGHGSTAEVPSYATPSPGYEHYQTGHDLMGGYVGPTIGTAWSWKSFDLAITTTIGYRSIGVPLLGYDPVPCGRNGTSRCPPSASNDSFFAQPRIALGIHRGTWGMGGYFGGDVTPSTSGWSTGLYFEVADSLFRQRAAASPPPAPTAP